MASPLTESFLAQFIAKQAELAAGPKTAGLSGDALAAYLAQFNSDLDTYGVK